MRFLFINITLFLFLIIVQAKLNKKQVQGWDPKSIPKVKKVPKTFTYQSTKGKISYVDDYFWMENALSNDTDLQKFLNDQSSLTESFTYQCKDLDFITKEDRKMYDYDFIDKLTLDGNLNKPQDQIYRYQVTHPHVKDKIWYLASPTEFEAGKKNNFIPLPGKPFLNETALSPKGDKSLTWSNISPDGKVFCYSVLYDDDPDGVANAYFRSTDSPLLIPSKPFIKGGQNKLPLIISGTNDEILWNSDNSGFFYIYQADNGSDYIYTIRYHQWGTKVYQDVTIFDAHKFGPDGVTIYMSIWLSGDNRWLIVSGTIDSQFYVRAYAAYLGDQTIYSENELRWISISPDYEYTMKPKMVIDDFLYFVTNQNLQNSKLVKIKLDFTKATKIKKSLDELQNRPKLLKVIDERKDATFVDISPFAYDKAIVYFSENGKSTLYVYNLKTGKVFQQLFKDKIFYLDTFSSNGQGNKIEIAFQTFYSPQLWYELEWKNDQIEVSVSQITLIEGSQAKDFIFEEFYAISKDGVKIPYFLTYSKTTKKDGKSPVWIHAYAAYGTTSNFYFNSYYQYFMKDYSGIVVWACPRGGGDEGPQWHTAATGINKQNTFDDILAIIDELIKNDITSAGNIVVEGSSAGAIAQAAVINQAKKGLIGAAIISHPPLDMFQFELRSPNGFANEVEFGNISDPKEISSIFAYSPYQNIDSNKPYPATLLIVGQNDDTISPSQAYKYLAKLQNTHPLSTMPFLLYDMTSAGHLDSDNGEDLLIQEGVHAFCLASQSLGFKRSTN